ncbi:MAG: sugar transferase [Nitrososphaerota archaeon]|nr:sugar transferase [Nitrososphaerota archaeon]
MRSAREFYLRKGKRSLDVCLGTLIFVLAIPVLILVCFLVLWDTGKSVLFIQSRPGKDGIAFKLYKFKTMRDLTDPEGHLLPDIERITSLGKFLRSTSLDELPELWNVIAGDMSLVGPRPLLMEYLGRYSEQQARRHEVKPGITGLAQVKGRNAIKFAQRFKYDVWYVDNLSFCLDIKILLMTAWKIVIRQGIDQKGGMEVFVGTKGS